MTPDSEHEWESAHVYNPTVIVEDGRIKMLYRAQGPEGVSRIGYATSEDGINFSRRSDPVVVPEHDYEHRGCEDPRVVRIRGSYYMTYTGFNGEDAVLCLATSDDFHRWEKHGPLFANFDGHGRETGGAWNKAGVIVPWKIEDRYVMYFGVPQMAVAKVRV